ncbi:hypothetical protein DDE05_11090 [Streptomyces cavourensis]|nr:hypothetical protein DDE05_11090 [Streptomyces cavourensis]
MDAAEEQDTAGAARAEAPATAPAGLVFEGVEFRYPDAEPGSPPVLARIDLEVRPGETMAWWAVRAPGRRRSPPWSPGCTR